MVYQFSKCKSDVFQNESFQSLNLQMQKLFSNKFHALNVTTIMKQGQYNVSKLNSQHKRYVRTIQY